MARQPRLSTDEKIQNMEYNLAKIKFVKSLLPDVKVSSYARGGKDYITFSAKSVNSLYNKYQFLGDNRYSIRVQVFYETDFTYNDKVETIKVDSSPRTCDIARKTGRWNMHAQKYESETINFSRLSFNLKKNNFRDDILNDCQVKIMEFIRANPGVIVDGKNLDSRLKKLLAFT